MPPMTSPRVWKRGFVAAGTVLVMATAMAIPAGATPIEPLFRKKPPASADEPAGEAAPSGGEAAPLPTAPQADDKDYPELQAEKEKKAADAALARQAKRAQIERDQERGEPIYKKWEFWAITGAVVVGAALTIWGGTAVWHQMRGGDVAACDPTIATDGCFGKGR
jgi:hypothetical protein